MQNIKLPRKNTLHPSSLAIQLVQHVRRRMIGMKPEDKVDCLHALDRKLQVVLQEAYEDAEKAGVYPPNPDDDRHDIGSIEDIH